MKISKFKLLLAGIFSVSSVGIPFSSFAASNKYEASVYVTNISGAEEAAAVLHQNSGASLEDDSESEYNPENTVIVDIDTNLSCSYNAESIYYYNDGGYYILKYSDPSSAKDAAEQLKSDYAGKTIFQDRSVSLAELTNNSDDTSDSDSSENTLPYGAELLGLDKLKAESWSGSVTAAVIDSGINKEHTWFKDRLDTENSVNLAIDYENNRSAYDDLGGHGTHVSGIITSSTPEQVKVMAVRVFDVTGTSTLTTITLGIDYAAEHGADIINMSLGQEYVSIEEAAFMNEAFKRAVNSGCSIFAASGNEYRDTSKSFPASSAWTIAVGSIEPSGNSYIRSDFSNNGPLLDFSAPGRDITSAWIDGSDAMMAASGTSMATPFLAAEAAYIKLMHPEYTQVDVYASLQDYAVDLGEPGKDNEFGCGYVDLSDYISRESDTSIRKSQSIYTDAVINTDMNHAGEILPLTAHIGRGDGVLSFISSDTSVAEIKDNGIKINNAGNCEITAIASATDKYLETSKRIQLVVSRGVQEIQLDKTDYTQDISDGAFKLNAKLAVGDGEITFKCNKKDVVTVSPDGTVIPKSVGSAEVYAVASSTDNFLSQISEPIHINITSSAVIGDVNDDGIVQEKDVILLARYVALWDNISINQKNADINGDGKINEADVLLLARKVASN